MKAARLQYLILALVTTWFGATAVHATDAESPIGLWKGEDATFEMFESDGKLSAKIVALSEPKTSEGKEKTDIHNPDPTKRSHPIMGGAGRSGLHSSYKLIASLATIGANLPIRPRNRRRKRSQDESEI